ncbi:hypothetical protein THS27_08840 [Thalassospira sp. MCCC 1A01428]|nr:hypothetical protein THS27_08840 [Thalassospira sp. MCCC 1A01428]
MKIKPLKIDKMLHCERVALPAALFCIYRAPHTRPMQKCDKVIATKQYTAFARPPYRARPYDWEETK